jgi:hypothetical protein
MNFMPGCAGKIKIIFLSPGKHKKFGSYFMIALQAGKREGLVFRKCVPRNRAHAFFLCASEIFP